MRQLTPKRHNMHGKSLPARLCLLLPLAIAMSQRLPATGTKRAFLNDFLDADKPSAHANTNRYFTLLMDCWPRGDIRNFTKAHPGRFFRNVWHANNARLKTQPDCFNNYEIIDFDCPGCAELLADEIWDNRVATHRRISFFKLILILCDDAANLRALAQVLMKPNGRITVSLMSRVIIARRVEPERYELQMVYRISKESPLVYENYGNWSSKDGLKLFRHPAELTTRRRNLQGLFFSVGFTFDVPETEHYYDTIKYPETDSVVKHSYGMFQGLVDMLNITYEKHFYDTYGQYNDTTKKWTGASESLRTGVTNFSGSPLVIIKPRVQFIDSIIQISQKITLKFILKRPPMSYVRDIFSITFHVHVWYVLAAMLLVFSVCIGYLLYIERKVFGNNTGNANDGVLIAFESLSQQGSVVLTKTNAGEILLFTLSLACMFFYTAYSVNIVKLLQTTTNINTPKELLESPFEVGAEDTIYIRYYLNTEQDPVRKALYETKIGEDGFVDMQKGLERVRRGGYAFHVNKSPAYYYILRHFDIPEQCSLQLIAAHYLPTNLVYIPMPKATPYVKISVVSAVRIWETGVHLRHIMRFLPIPKCTGVAPSFKTIEIIDVESPFVIFLIGTWFAAVVFIIELLYHHRRFSTRRTAKVQTAKV